MKATFERLLNELPTIAVGVWAVLRVAGVDVDEETATSAVSAVEAVIGLALTVHVRRNVDGPVTLHKKSKEDRNVD